MKKPMGSLTNHMSDIVRVHWVTNVASVLVADTEPIGSVSFSASELGFRATKEYPI
jgi:hypothetical protein